MLCIVNSVSGQSEISQDELYGHIEFLTSDKVAGRFPGTQGSKKVNKYIRKEFKRGNIQKLGKTYYQKFDAKLRLPKGEEGEAVASTCNVIGYIEGQHPILKNEYIVLGAHYDHLGMGSPSSRAGDTVAIHYGADDNASGTAALLEIAEQLANQKDELKRSIIFVAFGAEEQGLLGSKYFVENSAIPLSDIVLMINMDMVGRLNNNNHLYMGGAGTFPNGVEFMKSMGENSDLNLIVHAGGVGGSDHVSFYKKQISVLGLHTGGHPQYHRPEDTIDLINFSGMEKVCQYIYQTIFTLANSDEDFKFIPRD